MISMTVRSLAASFLIGVSAVLSAADLLSVIPRQPGQVVKINLQGVTGSDAIQNDVIQNLFRQSGIDEKSQNINHISTLIDEILVVTPVLTEDNTFVFVKTKVPENVFCQKMTELTGIRHSSVKSGDRTENRIVLPATAGFPGISPKERTIAFVFLDKNIAVFAKDSLEDYWKCKPFGLPPARQKLLMEPQALVSGFFEPDPEFLRRNPMVPPFRLAFYSLAALPGGALRIKAFAECPDENSANLVQMQLQQFIMVGGILLNQAAPDLTPEWMSMFQIQRKQTGISLQADISANFLARLAETSEKIAGNLNPAAEPPKKESRN